MARPRVFVSSTYYDLKHLRSSLENFIESLGFDAILSEKGDIAYSPDIPLDESCYREVNNADIFVIIIGGRYGSEKSETRTALPRTFFDKYDSITKQEYRSAVNKDIPVYIMIEKSVYADYETFLRNKDNKTINYAHVDSVNIFHLIEEILSQPRNNAIQQFDRYADIEFWLKEQWAGLFRELLTRTSSQRQIASLASQVNELAEINKTLKTYLEQVVSKIAPEESAALIKSETERLETLHESLEFEKIKHNSLGSYLYRFYYIPLEIIRDVVDASTSIDDFINRISAQSTSPNIKKQLHEIFQDSDVIYELNKMRLILGRTSLGFERNPSIDIEIEDVEEEKAAKKSSGKNSSTKKK